MRKERQPGEGTGDGCLKAEVRQREGSGVGGELREAAPLRAEGRKGGKGRKGTS